MEDWENMHTLVVEEVVETVYPYAVALGWSWYDGDETVLMLAESRLAEGCQRAEGRLGWRRFQSEEMMRE